MIKIGILDDDERFAEQLREYLLEYAKKNKIIFDIQMLTSAQRLYQHIEQEGIFHILFLDIELQETTGVEIGKKLRSELKNESMQIVFVSSKEQYAMQLFEIRPMNFLVKPIIYEKVAMVMEEYKRLFQFQPSFFKYNVGKSEYNVNQQCIMYFQSMGKKIIMMTQNKSEEFYGKLSEIIPKLNPNLFCEVHKSYVINMQYVAQYRRDSIIMVDNEVIPISQSRRKYVSQKLLETNV